MPRCLMHFSASFTLQRQSSYFFSSSAGLGCEELPMQIFNVCTAKGRLLDTHPGWGSFAALDSTFKLFSHKVRE